MWKYLLSAGILAILIGCGGSSGGSTGTDGGGTGQVTRDYDGAYHGTFQCYDHSDTGNITLTVVDGDMSGTLDTKDGVRQLTAITYDNPIVVGEVDHVVFSSSIMAPQNRLTLDFDIYVPQVGFASKPAHVHVQK